MSILKNGLYLAMRARCWRAIARPVEINLVPERAQKSDKHGLNLYRREAEADHDFRSESRRFLTLSAFHLRPSGP